MSRNDSTAEALLPAERIESRIYLIRGQKVMLDRHLAKLYGVETRVLNQAVRRNVKHPRSKLRGIDQNNPSCN